MNPRLTLIRFIAAETGRTREFAERSVDMLERAGVRVVGTCEACQSWADWAPTPDDGSRWCSSTDCHTDAGEGCTRWEAKP